MEIFFHVFYGLKYVIYPAKHEILKNVCPLVSYIYMQLIIRKNNYILKKAMSIFHNSILL